MGGLVAGPELRRELDHYDAATAERREVLVEGLSNATDVTALRASSLVEDLGLRVGDRRSALGGEFLPVDTEGADAFVELLDRHPAFTDPTATAPALSLINDADDGFDPLAYTELEDVASFLVAGAIALAVTDRVEALDGLARVSLSADGLARGLRKATTRPGLPGHGDIDLFFPALADLTEARRQAGMARVLGALHQFTGTAQAAQDTVDANGISEIFPPQVCPGAEFEIRGSGFGATQPAGTEVLVPKRPDGCTVVDVVSWSDNVIRVIAPGNVSLGPVGFLRSTSPGLSPGLADAAVTLAREMQACFGQAAAQATYTLSMVQSLSAGCPPITKPALNLLLPSGLPVVDSFAANGMSQVTILPRTSFTLSWSVSNVTTLSIQRISAFGPLPPATPQPAIGSMQLTEEAADRKAVAIYRLTAANDCGQTTRTVTVTFDAAPNLQIERVEVIQATQTALGTVPLVVGKRTAVRVFVTSGLPNFFVVSNEAGAGAQPGVRATVYVSRGTSGAILSMPWNAGGIIAAPGTTNPDNPQHSLNFELPLEFTHGTITISTTASVTNSAGLPGTFASSAKQTVGFVPQQQQQILPIPLYDPVLLSGPPTRDQIRATIAGALPRFPVAEDGLIIKTILSTSLTPGIDLRGKLGWFRLISDLATWFFLFPTQDVGGLRTAFVPNRAEYSETGIGTPRVGPAVPATAQRVGMPAILAHEWGHAYGLVGHAGCPAAGEEGAPTGIDPTLPPRTRRAGVNVPDRSVIPAGTGELMSYCDPQSNWPSEEYWEFVRIRVPI